MRNEKLQSKIRYFFSNFWPILFLLGVWISFSSPYFIQHKIPYPSQYQVSFFTPWNAYSEYAAPIKNNALSDVVNQLYPWRHFTIEQLQRGELPLWNPYSFSGTPHLANYQSATFTPFNLFFFALPFIDAWSVIVLLQPLLAGIFLYVYLREIKLSQIASLIGSIAFMFSGFLTVWMPYGTLGMAIALLPLALFAVERYFKQLQVWYLFLFALSVIISFFSGHFQMSLYLACYVVAYAICTSFRTKNVKAFWYTMVAFVLGMVVSLFQILPSLEFYNQAVRSELFSNKEGIPWYYLVTIFAPDFFGNPVTRNDWLGHYAEWASFIGIIPFSLAFVALFVKKNKAVIYFFFFAGVATLLLSLDTPMQQLLAVLKIPIFSTSIPSRIIILFSFSFAVLAAFGFDFIKNALKEKSLKHVLLPFLPTVLLLVLIWIFLLIFPTIPQDKVALAKRNLLLPSVLFFTTVAFVFVTFLVQKKYAMVTFAAALLLLTAFDSSRFVQKWVPFENRSVLFPKVMVIESMQKNIGEGRVYGDFGAYLAIYYHLPVVEGYDPLYSKRYGEFIQSAKTGEYTPALRSEVVLDEQGKYTQRVLDVLGVTLIYQPIAHSNQSFAFPVWDHPENFPTLYRDDKFAVFANKNVMPRVQVFTQYEVITDSKKLLERFFAEDFDYRTVLLLEEDPGLATGKGEREKGKAMIVSYTPNKIVVKVHAANPSLLFLSDSYYPGWKAKVNGKNEKIYRADYTLRAVKVLKGESTVEFYY